MSDKPKLTEAGIHYVNAKREKELSGKCLFSKPPTIKIRKRWIDSAGNPREEEIEIPAPIQQPKIVQLPSHKIDIKTESANFIALQRKYDGFAE